MLNQRLRKIKLYGLAWYEILFCIVCFSFYFLWAIKKPFNYAPDEYMRYDVSLFMFNNNRLPVGQETINSIWGFSYAHMPNLLLHVLNYVFMKLASLFTSNEFYILLSARMVSVLAATGIIYFIIKTSKIFFDSPARWIMISLIAFIPQFAFLASYINNDILALLGVAIIMYSWALCTTKGLDFKICSTMAIGIGICAVTYYNSYAWILCSAVVFLVAFFIKERCNDYRLLFKYIFFMFCIVLLITGYFFVRHLIVYGDLLGFKTSRMYGNLYGLDYLKPANGVTVAKQGISLFQMLFGEMGWLRGTYHSFIGVFGYMQFPLPNRIYLFYKMFFAVAIIGLLCIAVEKICHKSLFKDKFMISIIVSFIVCIIVTVALSIYNSYTVDFQAQGRYCYPALPAIAYFVAKGFEFFTKKLLPRHQQYAFVGALCSVLAFIVVDMYILVYLPS